MQDNWWIWIVFFVLAPALSTFGRKLRMPKWLRLTLVVIIVGGFFLTLLYLAFA
jgi:hypothetical protein